jgi:transcriptional regulator with XRE-family HTH domain
MRSKAANAVDVLVGSRIRLFRMRRKLTQSDLGKALGVSFQQVQKYERGTNRVGAGRLLLIAEALNVQVSDFFADAEGKKRGSLPSAVSIFDPQTFRIAEAFGTLSDDELRAVLVKLVETIARKAGERA